MCDEVLYYDDFFASPWIRRKPLKTRLEEHKEIVEAERRAAEELERQECAKREAELTPWVQGVIDDIYRQLATTLNGAVGLLPEYGVYVDTKGPLNMAHENERQRVYEEIRRLSGLEVESCPQGLSLIKVRAQGYPKSELLPRFAELFAEFAGDAKEWKRFLPGFARECVRKYAGKLEKRMGNHLGITDEVASGFWNSNPDERQFNFTGPRRPSYWNLTEAQLQELADEMNKLINGGNISFGREHSAIISLKLESDPDKPPVPAETCEFDYTEFCNRHSKVSDSLQAIFDQVVANLEPKVANATQAEVLKPVRCLCSTLRYSGQISAHHIRELLERGVHSANLAKAVEDATGVMVTAMRVDTPTGPDYEVLFDYDIPAKTDELSQFCRDQLYAETAIRHIKHYKHRYFARWMVSWVLYQDLLRRAGKNSSMLADDRHRTVSRKDLLVPLNGNYQGRQVDLCAVLGLGEPFAYKVADEVEQYTEGFIKLSIEPHRYVTITIGQREFMLLF